MLRSIRLDTTNEALELCCDIIWMKLSNVLLEGTLFLSLAISTLILNYPLFSLCKFITGSLGEKEIICQGRT